MRQFLEHPAVALILTLLFTAIAASGKLSMVLSRVLLLATWASLAIFVYESSSPLLARTYARPVILIVAALVLFLVGWWSRPPLQPENSGKLLSAKAPIVNAKKLLSATDDVVPAMLEIGDSGAKISSGGGPLQLFQIWPFLRTSHLTIESIDDKILVTTDIRDKHGNLVAELLRNEWQVAPPPATWDRNYSSDSLEVRNAEGVVVLQVRALQDRIRLQGEWWDNTGKGLRIVKSPDSRNPGALILLMRINDNNEEPSIKAMFKYPSSSYFGVRTANDPR